MGNKLARTTQASPSEYYLGDLPSSEFNLGFKQVLGSDRFFKAILCRHDEGPLFVKIYFKRGDLDLREHARKLHEIREKFKNIENSHVLPFPRWHETDKAAYLFRQYFFSNLHDRISTRPFLSMIEKKWLTFQLLHAVKQSHERGVCHGDIKCENVLVTSWNWIYLADFASFKPTYIPDDNPADFSFFFDSGGRRRCYLAPERLYDPKTESAGSADAPLKPSMDMFSLGCVIAELFLEGQALFDLAQLLQYRKGQYDPKPSLEKISDTGIRSMILQMIHINPESRLSADDYLQTWAYDVFPTYFSPALHSLFSCLTVLESDARVTVIHNAFPEIRKQMIRDAKIKVDIDKGAEALPPSVPSQKTAQRNPRYKEDLVTDIDLLLKEEGTHHPKHEEQPDKPSLGFSYRLKAAAVKMAEGASMYEVVTEEIYENSLRELNESFGEVFYTPDCLENYTKFTHKEECMLPSQGGWTWEGDWEVNYKWSPVDNEGWRYCKCKNFDSDAALPSTWTSVCTSDSLWKQRKWTRKRRKSYCQLLLPNKSTNKTIPATSDYRCEGMVLVASVLCSCLRNVKHPFTRREGVQLLHECAMLCDDDTRLQLVVPYVVAMLQDSAAIVRCTALQTLTNVLAAVRSFPPSDSKVFPEYIFPLLSMVPDDTEESVRICYADSIHKIASTAYRFLCSSTPSDVVQKLRINNRLEAEAAHLRETIARILHDLVMTPTIRRALLQHIASLCEFFGKQCNDFLLPILPAFLNDRDKQLRAVFFEQIVHVCIFVGEVSTEAYILPYLEQALSNVEETSIVNALECIATLCVHRLLKKRVLLKTVERASPLLCHPSRWVRRAAITLVAASGSTLSTADAYAYLVPMLQPFLRREPVSVSSEAALLACLKPPVPREVFQKVLSDVMDTIEKPKHNVTDGRVIHMGKIPRYKQPPQPGEAEDGEKLKAMEGYLRNLSSTMHTWESENPEKMESSNYDVSTDFPLYSRPVTEKKMESSSVEEWSRIRPLDALTYSQWASPDSNADILQKSVITFPSKLATSSVYGVRRDSFAGSTMVSNVTRVPHSSCESFNKFLNTVGASSVDWRPQGTLVAHLQEHQRAVNQIAVSADNTFFASASNDGLVKVWDCRRLERDTSFKSKLTYSLNERVLSLTTLNPDHQIAAASSSGQIHVFCVNYATRDSSTPERYSGISNVRKTDPQEGAVLTLQSLYAEENVPMLLYSTQRCGIHLWDFRKQADAWLLKAKVEQGYITAMEVDPTHNWLVSGTSRGVLTLWDLRFHVPVHSWQLPGFHPVEAMCVPRHSSLPRPFVYVAAGREEVAVWNLENGTCQQVLRTNAHEGGTVPAALPHWSKTFSMKKQQEPSKHPDYRLDELNDPPPRLPGTRALLPSGVSVLTGGTDCRIRLWDHLRPENDYCVCGPTIATVGDQVKKDKPEQMKYKVKKLSGVHVTQELMPTAGPIREVSVAATDTAGCHRDTITSLAMAEPNNQQLLISSSRDGVIKVWK